MSQISFLPNTSQNSTANSCTYLANWKKSIHIQRAITRVGLNFSPILFPFAKGKVHLPIGTLGLSPYTSLPSISLDGYSLLFWLQHWPELGGFVFVSLTGVGSLGLVTWGVVCEAWDEWFAKNDKKGISTLLLQHPKFTWRPGLGKKKFLSSRGF